MAQNQARLQLLTVSEVAEMLRVSDMTVYRLIKAGQLRALQIGKSYRLREEDVDAFLSSRFTEAGGEHGLTSSRLDTVTFLSDYGHADEFVGVVRSVLRSLAPEAAVVDLTHDIPAHDVRAGALCLARAAQYLCPGVVLAVVDPGVGTDRRAIAVEVGQGESFLVGPDNGLLAPAVAMVGGAGRAVSLTNPDYQLPVPGPTFAGRDIFAPAAAHLCNGVDLYELGDPVDAASLLPGVLPVTHFDGDELVAEVLWVDRYGNAQLNVDPDEVAAWGSRVRLRFGDGLVDGRTLVQAHTYAALGPGDVGLVVDSYGLLSVALPRASAADRLGLAAGDPVRLVRLDEDDDAGRGGVTSPVQLRPRGVTVRPATTIALALLLAAIFIAAIVQFAVLAD